MNFYQETDPFPTPSTSKPTSRFKKSSFAPSVFPKIHNVNISFKIPKASLDDLFKCKLSIETHNNLHIIRDPEIKNRVYTIFNSGHINITGLKNFHEIKGGLDRFNFLFKQSVKEEDIRINNSTSSGNVSNNENHLNFKKIKEEVAKQKSSKHEITFNFRPHHFPGAILRRKDKSTIILFSNGKYNIVGAKDRLAVRDAHRILNAIIRNTK